MDTAVQHKVDHLQTTVSESSEKFLCFTSVDSGSWILHATDGIDVWRLELDSASLESHRDLADVSSYEAYFSRFRHAFKMADVDITNHGHKVSLSIGSGSTALRFELYEASAYQRKTDLKNCLFWLATTSKDLQTRLIAVEEEFASLKKQKATQQTINMPDFESRKRSSTQTKAPKPQGLSIVNPTSRKRKTAKGVEFD